MMSEFIERTGFEPSADEYAEIEEAYYNFDGNKDEFCKAWVEDGGIERTSRARIRRIAELEDLLKKNARDAARRVSELEQKLEKEQEWRAYTDERLVSCADYDRLAHFGRRMSDEEAVAWIAQEFGFDPLKIRINRKMKTYDVNRHNQLRAAGEMDRSPIYDATDYYYVFFTVAGWEYEATNGSLNRI